MTPSEPPNDDRRRTLPWHDDECCYVGALRCVYVLLADGTLEVKLPGGRSASAAMLAANGYRVTLPRRVRTHD